MRELAGWSMPDHLRAGLCVAALVMALQRRRPAPGLVHHGDRGVQYAAEPYRDADVRSGRFFMASGQGTPFLRPTQQPLDPHDRRRSNRDRRPPSHLFGSG